MANPSIIIPFSSTEPHRLKSFHWNFERWQRWFPNAEIIISNPVSNPETAFSRSKARNFGAQTATNELLVFADADTFCRKESLDRLCALVKDGEVPWGFPAFFYFNASQECTEYLLKQDPTYQPLEDEIAYDHRLTDSVGGIFVVRKESWELIKGEDERFIGWGMEDRSRAFALDTMVGKHYKIRDFQTHLYHPASEADCFGQPMIVHNRKLNMRYEAANGDKPRMLELIKERGK